MSRTRHIFVDYENVHEVDLDLVEGRAAVVHLVLGERHKNLPLAMVKQLVRYQEQVHIVEAGQSGKNALDFVLACRVGIETVAHPEGAFHIVSRDTGFDALILYLRKHQLEARRDESFAQAFDLPVRPVTVASERVKIVIARWKKNQKNRPKKKRTLLRRIHSDFKKQLSDAELQEIVQTLIADQVIEIGPKWEVVYKI